MQLTKHWAGQLDAYVIDLAWSPDGTQLAAASPAGAITIFAAGDGAKPHTLPGHEGGTNALAWQPRVTSQAHPGKRQSSDAEPQTAHAATPLLLASGGQDGG